MKLVQSAQEPTGGLVVGIRELDGTGEVSDGRGGIEFGPLEGGWQEPGSPVVHAVLRFAARIGNGYVSWQALILTS